jgi:cytochrome c2
MVNPCNRPYPYFKALFSLVLLSFFLNISFTSAQDGKQIYKANCRSCHFLNDKPSTGPGLQGVSGKHSKEWAFKWVKDNVSLTKSGDPEAVATSALTTNTMTTFAGVLTDEQIKAAIDYIWSEPGEPVVVNGTPGPSGPEGPTTTEGGINPFYLTLIIIAILLILVSALKSIRRNMENAVNEKKGLPPVPEYNWRQWASHNKRSVALIIIVVTCYGSAQGWDALMGIGVYEGYKPSQPIKFSHKLHAGDNKIACEYCHSGVLKSKVAGVPSVNICMNCHKGIQSGPQYGETEINKIYEAAGWDKTALKYNKKPTPLVWNKVHVLPDFVFFSHQQHVVAGRQECKNCHGDLTTMDVAQQKSPLTMGWCVECHNKTAVPGMKDNPYYEEFHKKLAEKYRGKSDSVITVARMGGIECSKCHY